MPEAVRLPRAAATPVLVAATILVTCWISVAVVGWKDAPDLGHCWVVPLLMGYLAWERWAERPNVRPLATVPWPWWLAMAGIGAAALVVRLLLTPYPLWPSALLCFLMLAAAATLAGAWLLAGWPGIRWVGGPLVLLACCLPLPSSVETTIVLPLREAIARIVAEMCNVLGHPAIASGTSIQLGGGWVGIEEACSGIRSLQACALFGLFFGEWFRFSAARRLALLGFALLSAIAGNFGRVLFLALHTATGGTVSPGAHDLAGWVAMIGSLALIAILGAAWNGWRLPSPGTPTVRRTAASAAPRWIIAMALLFAANEIVTRVWYAVGRREHSSVPRWTAVFPTAQRNFSAEPLSSIAAGMLRPDRYVAGHWTGAHNLRIEAYFIEWTHGQVARSVPFLHNPTICLPYSGCELTTSLAPIDVTWRGPTIPFATYQFRRAGEPLLVAFTIWDPMRAEPLERPMAAGSWWQWFLPRWRDVTAAREDQPAQLLAVSIAGDADKRADLAAVLQTLVVPSP